jgi:hypothetical protein
VIHSGKKNSVIAGLLSIAVHCHNASIVSMATNRASAFRRAGWCGLKSAIRICGDHQDWHGKHRLCHNH